MKIKLGLSSICLICVGLILPAFVYAKPRPDLYPNAHLKSVGQVRADRDIIDCEIQTQDYLASKGSTQPSTLNKTARGAVRGTAMGALAGTITGAGAGRGAGAGAAVGGLSTLMQERRTQREYDTQGSPEYRKYMEGCLTSQGYSVVGWRS